jgi:5'-deoxynucleotidase YfbR-like HD superfamily hydrolase
MAKPNSSTISAPDFVDLFLRANESKKIPRTGWGMQGIPNPESVAEHTYSLSFLTLQLAPLLSEHLNYPLNINKLVKMAILHDMGEVETGDIVVSRGTIIDSQKRAAKEEKEKEGIKKLFKKTDKTNFAVSLFTEMLERESLEANIFWQLDKLDMAIQALEYEIEYKKDLSEFYENAKANITDELLTQLLNEILNRRSKT